MFLINRCVIGAIVALLAGSAVAQAQSALPGVRPEAELLQPGPAQACPPSEPTDPAITSSLGDRFIAGQHFRETNAVRGDVAIAWLGTTFRQRFVSKTESSVARTTLQPFRLRRAARASEIVAWLGDRGETTLGELWCLLTLQPNGEAGALLTSAVPNLFFVRDRDGRLWTVDVLWGGPGWEIGASAIDGDRPWDAGAQAFSR
ncbi:hypothetical protein SR870_10800 [Rhodopseudomonas palustris]|uniref:hypothetical protein n=1 Tax=Rhodopseudomonas palustris TaxID=1076 RepID=UPI002ACDEBAE|nr:hypothetical protein [Rhodopseudomonas palustris]WQH01723.1 hypothetical protein SR870_10800 [Rhodopseudomonas palustris]